MDILRNRICSISAEVNTIIDKCLEQGLIDEVFVEHMMTRANAEMPLNIGVIGKMKAGKSTLINALLFQDYVLSADVQPLTAVLTKISYNEDDKTVVHVDFFSEQDIQDMETSSNEQIKKQLDRIKLINNWESLLGTTGKEVDINDLHEYTDEDGTFASITKEVDIKYHNESLKGISIVDTPGFNDPVSSRVEATKLAISSCQVLLFAHDTTSHYDSAEKEILQSQIGYAQTSKLIDVVTHIDTCKVEEWDKQLQLLADAKNCLIRELGETHYISKLLKEAPNVYVSGLMALIGFRRSRGEILNESEKRNAQNMSSKVGVISDEEFIESSNIGELCRLINELSNQKETFISSSFPNELRGALLTSRDDLNRSIEDNKTMIALLSGELEGIKTRIKEVEAIEKKLYDLFSSNSIYSSLSNQINGILHELISDRDTAAEKEFTETNYSESNIFTRGKKDNYSRYTWFINRFTTDIREKLFSFNDEFKGKIKEGIRKVVNDSLVNVGVAQSDVSFYTNSIINNCDQIANIIDTRVSSYTLSNRLKGNPQHVQYSNDFINHFNDDFISGLINSFKVCAESFLWKKDEASKFKDYIQTTTQSLTKDLRSSIDNPEQKESTISGKKEEISEMSKKIDSINAILKENSSIFSNCF